MDLNSKYRLDLKWDKAHYEEGVCYLYGAYFSGPVLKEAEQIASNNSMLLDFFKQYFVLVTNVYIGTLHWGEVIYKNEKVYLQNCRITHNSELHKVPKLEDKDMLIIDCRNHDREIHDFFPTYKTYVTNADTQIYNFI